MLIFTNSWWILRFYIGNKFKVRHICTYVHSVGQTREKNDILSLTISFFKTENETTSVRLVVMVRKQNKRRRFNLLFSKNDSKRNDDKGKSGVLCFFF